MKEELRSNRINVLAIVAILMLPLAFQSRCDAASLGQGRVIHRQAGETLAAVELDPGDSLAFTLRNGKTRSLTLQDTWARIILTNLKESKKGFGGGG
ncbi:hypothetical protein FJY63_05960, partial [Candidatus Sumerlaeota bacterium]|nr:hypothetical protein [Candidatus Sumerlaeota bacterium]